MTSSQDDKRRAHKPTPAGSTRSRKPELDGTIQEQAALLSVIFAHSPDVMAFVDPHFVIRAANETFAREIGIPLDQIVGRPGEETIPNWLEEVGQAYRQVLQTGQPYYVEAHPFVFKDRPERGVTYWSGTLSPIYDSQGKLLGCLLLRQEVTETQQAEEARKLSESSYRAIFDSANDAIFVHDLESGQILDVNRRMTEMYGYSADEARQLSVEDLSAAVPPYTQQEAQGWLRKAVTEGPQLFEWLAKDKSGQQFWVEVNIKRAAIGGQDRLLALVRDITRRKSAQEAAAKLAQEQAARAEAEAARQQISSTLERISDAFFALDREGRFTYLNDGAERLFQKPRAELIGRNIQEVIPQSAGSGFEADYRRAIAKQETIELEEFLPNLGRWVEIRAYPSEDGLTTYLQDVTERRRAEEALRDSEEKYRLLVENIPDVTWLADERGNTIFISPNIERIDGYTQEEFYQGGPDLWFDRIHPDDVDLVRESFARLFTTGEAFDVEYRFQRRDGKWMWWHDRSMDTFEEDGQRYARGIVSDITERHRMIEAEQKARQDAERSAERIARLQAVTAALSGAIDRSEVAEVIVDQGTAALGARAGTVWLRSEDGEFLDVLRAIGYPAGYPDTAGNIPIATSLPVAEVVRSGEPIFLESLKGWVNLYPRLATITSLTGSQAFAAIPLIARQTVIGVLGLSFAETREFDEDDRAFMTALAHQCAQALDRTRLYEAAQSARADAQQWAAELDATITSMVDGVVIYNSAGELVRLNPLAVALLGYSPEDLKLPLPERLVRAGAETADGRPFPPDEYGLARALQGESVPPAVMVLHPVPGRAVWVSVGMAPIRSSSGALLGVISTFTDITRLHELQEQREQFIHLISHDLRNPLATITGMSGWLSRLLAKKGLDQEAHSAQSILTSARRMNSMIQELVESVRLESGQLEMHKETVDLLQLIAEVSERIGSLEDRMRIHVESPVWVPPVAVDVERIERVIVNLTTNALKYSPAGSPVLIRLWQTDVEAVVAVADQGIGIPPEDLPHLFNRYYRSQTGKRKAEGLGLGLYISRLIVEAHGGRIWVESTVGKGSTFYFSLPRS